MYAPRTCHISLNCEKHTAPWQVAPRGTYDNATPSAPTCFTTAWAVQRCPSVTICKEVQMVKSVVTPSRIRTRELHTHPVSHPLEDGQISWEPHMGFQVLRKKWPGTHKPSAWRRSEAIKFKKITLSLASGARVLLPQENTALRSHLDYSGG
jgi:hypothetical protein